MFNHLATSVANDNIINFGIGSHGNACKHALYLSVLNG